MNKKTKLAIPFAVLALTCGIAAGCGGCNPTEEHTHSYTAWAYNESQHWKECPDDHVKDDGTIADHVFVDGTCECGATQQTPPVTDVTITNGTTDTNGTVTLSKTTAKAGDSVTVTVAPSDGYQLKSLTVNGANVFGAMTGNTYEFTVSENTTVVAAFEKIASSSVNAQITGKKYGVTGNSLAAGTQVTLSAENREDVTTTITEDGKIQVAEIAGDNWKVKVAGYIAAEIIIPRDAEYTTAISLEYDLMENLKKTWGNTDSVDLSGQNDGKIVYQSGYVEWVSSKDSYSSVAITATVVEGGSRQGVFIRFAGNTYDDDKYVMVSKEIGNEQKIGWCAMDGGVDYKGSPLSTWEDSIKPITDGEYELTLVRNGADIYFFVDGEYITKKTYADYADKECYVGLFCTGASEMKNTERTFSIGTYDDFFKTVTITNTTENDANGTLSIQEGEHKVGEQVEITVTPDPGYLLGSLKVNGKEYADSVVNGKLTLTLTSAAVEVKASFNTSAFSASNAECPQGTYDFDSYIINDKLVLGYKRYNGTGDAPSYGNLIGTGLDDVTRYGGDFNGSIGNIKFTANGTTSENCLFLDNGVYKDVTVTVPAGATQILVFTGTYDGGDKTITCNLYDANGHCVGNGTFLHARGDNPRADLVTFTVDQTKIGEGGTYTLRIGGNCSTTVAAIVVLGEKHNVTITDGTTDEHGTVTIDKTTATTGDKVTVTFTPSANYRIKDLKVDGQSVIASTANNTYTFIALKDTTVVAEFEQIQQVSVTLTINATDYTGKAVTFANGTQIKFKDVKGFVEYTYTVGSNENFTQMYAGTYTVACEGYFETTVEVEADNGEVTVNLSEPIATTESNEITIKEDKTITVKGNGSADRDTNNRKINAEYKLTEEQQNSTAITLTFTAKATMKDNRSGGDWAASRFGVQIGEGEIGFMVFPRYNSSATAADVAKFIPGTNLSLNPDKDGKTEQKWHGDDTDLAWLAAALYSENGVQFRVTRANGIITIEAKNGENWVMLDTMGTKGETANVNDIGKLTIGNTVKNQIKFTAGGDHWTFSDISVTLPAESEKATLTTSVNDSTLGSIATDIQNYYKGDKAVITVTAVEGYELEKIVIGETEITEGWTKEGLVYTYELTLEGDTTVVAHIKAAPEVTLSGVTVNITDGTNKIDLGDTVQAKLTPSVGDAYDVTLTKGADGAYTFGGSFLKGEYSLSLVGINLGYSPVTVTIADTVSQITMTYSLTSATDKGPREDASIKVTNDTITIVGTQNDAFAEWGSNHNDNQVPYVTLNISDEVKNAKNVMLEFNLKTSNQSGYFINGFGVGMTGFNGLRMLFADTADKAYTPDGKIITAILNGRKTGEDNISAGGYCSETYGWIETLALTENGVNIRAVRNGTTLKFFAQNSDGKWVLIQFLAPVNGDYSNLVYVDHVTVVETDLNDIRFLANGANFTISDIEVSLPDSGNIQGEYEVNASFAEDAAHGYAITVEKNFDYFTNNAGTATVTIVTSNAYNAWSYFPNAITVNGAAIGFNNVTKESLGANRCKYTVVIENITENTDIVVTVGAGTKVAYSESVNNAEYGSIVCDMNGTSYHQEYYWNDLCTFTVTANDGYELESLVIGEGENAITITKDSENSWTQNGKVYKYEYLVTGDIKVIANFSAVKEVDVTVTVSAKDTDGTTAVTPANGTQIKLVSEDGNTVYTYVVGGETNPAQMAVGTYNVTCYGYADTTVTVSSEGGSLAINLVKVIGYTTSNEITIDSENGTISITGNGLSDREPNQRKINAEYVISDEVKNSTDITLTFTVKATKKDNRGNSDWVGSRFGVQIGEGEIGFMVFPRNNETGTASDVAKLIPGTNLALNPDKDGKTEQKWHGDDSDLAWLADALYSENGVEFKIVRSGGVISIFAKNGDNWVALDTMGTKGETANSADIGKLAIADNVKNEIKFTAGGDNWTFSNISVTVNPSDEGEQA